MSRLAPRPSQSSLISAFLLVAAGCSGQGLGTPVEICGDGACSDHGVCSEVDGEARCACAPGYVGAACEACAPGYHPEAGGTCAPDGLPCDLDCGAHGTCVDPTDPRCACDEGYAGDRCEACAAGWERDRAGDCVRPVTGDCAGPEPLAVAPGTVTGSTTGAPDAMQGSCTPDAHAGEWVYRLTLGEPLRLTLESGGFDTVLHLRRSCADPATEIACDDDSAGQQRSRLVVDLEAGTYYLAVDGYDASGDFTLTVDVACPAGRIFDPATGTCLDDPCQPNPCTATLRTGCVPELPGGYTCTCDPGAVVDPEDPDRCIPNPDPTGESCLDALPLPLPGVGSVSGTTVGAAGDGTGTCGGEGPDRVYGFTLAERSRVILTASGFDTVLHLRRGCADPDTEVACDDDGGADHGSRLTLVLEPGPYFLFLDSYGEPGAYGLEYRAFGDPCADEEAACPGAPVCRAVADWSSFTCACPEGTLPHAGSCVDDPCAPSPCTAPGRTRCTAELPAGHTCACTAGYRDDPADPAACVPDPAAAEWAVISYVNGDNNLEPNALLDVVEMTEVGSTPDVQIVALVDTVTAEGGTARLLHVEAGSTTLIADQGELDLSDWRTLRDFGVWAVQQYPARNYLLVLWDHGGGWKSGLRRSPIVKGFSNDDSGTAGEILLSNGDYARALTEITAAIGRPVDLLAFDACLMGLWEVAEVSQPFARLLLASAETIPVDGFRYQAFLGPLVADPGLGPAEIGALIVDSYADLSAENSTLTVADLEALDGLTAALSTLADALLDQPALHAAVEQARAATQSFSVSEHLDLVDLATRLAALPGASAAVVAATTGVIAAHDQVVLHHRAQADYPGAHGLAVYLPPRGAGWDPAYVDVGARWSQRSTWDEWVAAFAQ